MMEQEDFFFRIQEHHQSQLPFVVFRKPNQNKVEATLQLTSDVFYAESYQESGFVFAPFHSEEKTILFPFSESSHLQIHTFNSEAKYTLEEEVLNLDADKKAHLHLVSKAVEALNGEPDFKKVVLSRKEVLKVRVLEPLKVFKNILNLYPTAFCYLWFHPKVGLWLGATPETLLQVYRNKFSTMSLAGTQKLKGSEDVLWADKEREEQQIVTDTIVESLKKVNIKPEVSGVITHQAGSLLHLKTDISGLLQSKILNLKSLIEALHPTPAVCGLPRERAKDFIRTHENYKRTFYSGFLGELNKEEILERNMNRRNVENSAYRATSKSSHLFVNLRSMELVKDEVHLFVGGGITASSNPELEWEETVHKTGTMKQILF